MHRTRIGNFIFYSPSPTSPSGFLLSGQENTVDANMNEVAAEQSNQEDRTMILDEASEEDTLVSESLLDTVISDVLKDDEQVEKRDLTKILVTHLP